MGHIVAFANQKGGVGKTTLTLQTAFYYSLIEGKKVLVIDLDKQGNSTKLLLNGLGLTSTRSYELFNAELPSLDVQETQWGIDLLGASLDHDEVFAQVMAIDDEIKVHGKSIYYPKKWINIMRDAYDWILIDCKPELDAGLIASIMAADYVVSPLKVSGQAMQGLQDMLATMKKIKEIWASDLKLIGIAINDYDKSANQTRALEEIKSKMGGIIFDQVIRHRSPIDMAMTGGVPVWNIRGSRSAASEFSKYCAELERRINEDKIMMAEEASRVTEEEKARQLEEAIASRHEQQANLMKLLSESKRNEEDEL